MDKALEIGSKAPSFSLPSDGEGSINLKDFKGEKVILYFYPKDDTAGCTKEAIEFTKNITKFKRAGAHIIGVSKDSIAKHKNFKEKHALKVMLASDETGEMVKKYGVWTEKSMYGRKYMGIERTTFLIDEKGAIRRIWRKVRVSGHVDEVLAEVKGL